MAYGDPRVTEERRGNPLLGPDGASGLLSGRNPLAGRRRAKQTPEEKASQKNAKKRKKAKPKTGTDAIPGHDSKAVDAYERGEGPRPKLGPGQHIDPDHAYGSGSGNKGPDSQLKTGAGQNLAKQHPESVFNHHLANLGLPTDPMASNFGRTLQNLFESVLLPNYNTVRDTQNMDLTFDTFLRDWEGGIAPPVPVGPAPPGATAGIAQDPTQDFQALKRPDQAAFERRRHERLAQQQQQQRNAPPPQQRLGAGPGQGLDNPFIRQRPGQNQERGGGNPFMNGNPLLNRGRGGLGGSLPAPRPKKQPKPKQNKGAAKGLTGTKPVNPNYGATGDDALANYRNYHLSLDPMRRGENTANIFGGGATSWAAYR